MANIMTKRGSIDNEITYEHICDTAADMASIDKQYKTLGSVCIVIQGESGGLEVYIAGSNREWASITEIGGSNNEENTLGLYVCTNDEIDAESGLPDVSAPTPNTIYLVASREDTNNIYDEFVYVDEAWERVGGVTLDLSTYAPKASPEFTGSISLNRAANTTPGENSIAVGYHNAANGLYSAAFGRDNVANGTSSFAGGENIIAAGGSEFVIGGSNALPAAEFQPNTEYAANDYVIYQNKLYYCATPHTSAATFEADSGWYHARKNLLTVGNGNNSNSRSNAFVVDLAGNGRYKGDIYIGCNADSSGGYKVAKDADVSLKADKDNTVITGSLSLGRKAGTTVGTGSVALGSNVTASSSYSYAEGTDTTASEYQAHAEGYNTVASGVQSHAEGSSSIASGAMSHAEGQRSNASGPQSHAEGNDTIASGAGSHAEGYGGKYTLSGTQYTSQAAGMSDHVEGYQCLTASKQPGNHAEGYQTQATGGASHAEGANTVASGNSSHTEGSYSKATSSASHAEGNSTTASGAYAHAEGYNTIALGSGSHAEGGGGSLYLNSTNYTSEASGTYSHAEGECTRASGEGAHSEGYNTMATQQGAHSEGNQTQANGYYSHAEGNQSIASNSAAHAEGYRTIASGYNSHVEGYYSSSSGSYSHAEGYYTNAEGSGAHAEGKYTKANGKYTHASGLYNATMQDAPTWVANTLYKVGDCVKYNNNYYKCKEENSDASFTSSHWSYIDLDTLQAFVVGNGTSSTEAYRSNAMTLDWSGDLHLGRELYINANADGTGGSAVGARIAALEAEVASLRAALEAFLTPENAVRMEDGTPLYDESGNVLEYDVATT